MSQASLNVPVTGPSPPTTFAGIINGGLDALVSKNSGAAAPANFPTSPGAPTAFQDWADTSPGAGLVDLRQYDGSNWLNTGAQDQTNHVWMPKVGGGSGTIAAAATTDIGSVRQSYVLVTGAVPGTPITSFGSNALLNTGETRFLRFTAAGILTYNAASMILPGAADLPFNVGDTAQAVYLGGGNWLVYDYRSALSRTGRDAGDLFEKWGTGAVPGAVRCNGLTIGNGASGATERANADTVNLFIYLYLQDVNLSVSGGRSGGTRATAITDYNLNKTIVLPDLRLRATFGLPVMGNVDCHRGAGQVVTTTDTLGTAAGEAAHVQALKEQVPHVHSTSDGNTNLMATPTGAKNQLAGGASASQTTVLLKASSGGSAVTVTSASPGVVTYNSHGLAADTPFQFDFEVGGALPTGTSAATTYYVSAAGLGANSFQFSLTPGGASVNTTSTGTSVLVWAGHNTLPPYALVTKYIAL